MEADAKAKSDQLTVGNENMLDRPERQQEEQNDRTEITTVE